MIRLEVSNIIDDYNINFVDSSGSEYLINIDFVNWQPKVGSIIFIAESLLLENNFFTFDVIGSKYGKQNNLDKTDVIKVIDKDNEFYMQRIYG